jgi:hypothetical protein
MKMLAGAEIRAFEDIRLCRQFNREGAVSSRFGDASPRVGEGIFRVDLLNFVLPARRF